MNATRYAVAMLALLQTGLATADLSANAGFATDYYYRGIFQATASASAGIDYTSGGIHAGAWAADVKDGLEVDGYVSYSAAIGDATYSVGYTGYFYSGDFDDTYQEINLGGGYGPLTLDIAIGRYDNFAAPTADYLYYAIQLENRGFYARAAAFARDFSGEYLELGYATTVAELDLGVNLLFNDKTLNGNDSSGQALVLTVSKTFELR